MRESVQAEVLMSFVVSEELSFRIPVELRYEGKDPFAVRMTFHLPGDAPVTWVFGRELLLTASTPPAVRVMCGSNRPTPVTSCRMY